MRKLYLLICIALVASILSSCKDDESLGSGSGVQQDLDVALRDVLIEASDDGSTDFYQLPSSSDFQSIPQDPNNPITTEKVALGKLLFFETACAQSPKKEFLRGTYSCASCHSTKSGFQAGNIQGLADGGQGFGNRGEGRTKHTLYKKDEIDVQPIRTPSNMNVAYQTNVLWNGQFGATNLNVGTEAQWEEGTPKATNHLGFEGVETQAIAGLDVHRMLIEGTDIIHNPTYIDLFENAFPGLTDEELFTRENAGLAIAAYERTLLANESNFQKWLRGEHEALNSIEKKGAILFFGKAGCAKCHTGPALNSMEFHALGMADLSENNGAFHVDPDDEAHKGRGGFTKNSADDYKFKVPQLYNLIDSPFYGHGGNFNSVEAVIRYKNNAQSQNPNVPESQLAEEFTPLGLDDEEVSQIAAFIRTGLYDPNLARYAPEELPSGNCFPNNDFISKEDLGCDF